jgi:hypothetical protein
MSRQAGALDGGSPGPGKALRLARRWMLGGFLLSFFGTSIVEGLPPALVAFGVLPLLWLPLMSSVEMLQDMLSVAVARWIEGLDPGKVLMTCELVDSAFCLLAIGLLGRSGLSSTWILCGYLLLASLTPVVIDIAEEFYAESLGSGAARGRRWTSTPAPIPGYPWFRWCWRGPWARCSRSPRWRRCCR